MAAGSISGAICCTCGSSATTWKTGSGTCQYLAFYLVCGVAATFAQLAFRLGSDIPNLGASGAIAGVLGAYILLFPYRKVRVMLGYGITEMPSLIVIGLWFVLQLFSGIGSVVATTADTGGVAFMAHIGGFIAGVVLAFILRGTGWRRPTGQWIAGSPTAPRYPDCRERVSPFFVHSVERESSADTHGGIMPSMIVILVASS